LSSFRESANPLASLLVAVLVAVLATLLVAFSPYLGVAGGRIGVGGRC
jgi:hypothetical protein